MKFLLTATTILAALLAIALGQAEAGVSVSVAEPGFYGRLDIGGYPPPRVIYEQPVIERRVNVWYPPLYLRVPPGHVKRWYKYCHEYDACGRPVYFVHDDWYRDVYVPRYREYHHDRGHYRRPPVHRPEYYEYRERRHQPSKKVYIREGYHEDYRHEENSHRGRGHNR